MSNHKPGNYKSVAARFDKTLLANVNRGGAQDIEVGKLTSRRNQPRKFFDQRELVALSASIKSEGVRNAIHARRLPDGKLEIIAGERRYRAACLVGMTRVPVIIHNIDDAEADRIAILDNLHRSDLNPIEETEAVILLVQTTLSLPRSEAINKLRAAANVAKGRPHVGITNDEADAIRCVFDRYVGRLTILSFAQARLPLLDLAPELYHAILQGHLPYTVALPLKNIKDDTTRHTLLRQAIDEQLTRTQVLRLINDVGKQPVSLRHFEGQIKPARDMFRSINLKRIPEEKRSAFIALTEEFMARATTLLSTGKKKGSRR